ncbi:hypothetical protein CRM22_001755 [Opisthorchis felineus]|uniref:Membrane insertase YidC/Oxa/ALB C-terminal domain-containing protein n=1 Tax=Opisthorchis felineus TaxID=147828 RepID=A0A4S2M9A9_OPIFE|nr:hypothetical protein CRM22_001755 [Opisthorchis felineus]
MTMQVLRNCQLLRQLGRCTSPFSATKTWLGHSGIVGHSNFQAGLLLQSKLWLSTTTPDTLGPLPDIPLPPVTETMLNTLGEPSLASLGLCSYWPSGWYQAVLEALHVSLDLPWWAAIAATTLCIRLCLFPFIIGQRRSLAKYGDAMPRLTLLQERLTNARLSGDYFEMMKVSKEMQEIMRSKDVNPLRSMKLLIVQVPIFLSVFAGIRGMASLPVPSMKTGGLSWFTDLTVPDPYYLLPFMSMASIILMFETGADMSTKGMTPIMKTGLRIFPVFGFLMVMNMPSAILWYWTVSNFISLVQAFVLRIPVIRDALKLPKVTAMPEVSQNKRGFIEGFRETMANSKLLAELEARERLDAQSWQRAGKAAAPRTYAYNPKAPRPIRTTATVVDSGDSIKQAESRRG